MLQRSVITITLTAFTSVLFASAHLSSARAIRGHRKDAGNAAEETVRQRKAIVEFEQLVAEMDALSAPENGIQYRNLNEKILRAMHRATSRARAHAIQARRDRRRMPRSETPTYTPVQTKDPTVPSKPKKPKEGRPDKPIIMTPREMGTKPPVRETPDHRYVRGGPEPPRPRGFDFDGRAERMQAILWDARAIHRLAYRGNEHAMQQNRALLGEFLELMRADLAAGLEYRRYTNTRERRYEADDDDERGDIDDDDDDDVDDG